jgi:UDP-glucose 4-epimerase
MYTKTIAITGASGFIGSNLSRHLKIDFNVIEINIRDYKEVRELTNFLEKNKITHFINCIGGKSVGFSLKNPLFDFESNVSVGVFILHAISAVKFNIHFSHISSAGIYGEQNELFNEHFIFSPYATHKKIFEFSIQSLLKNNFLIIRPFSVYGTGLKKQILFDAYKKFNKEKNVVFYGTGNEIRNFIYIDDLCEIIHKH